MKERKGGGDPDDRGVGAREMAQSLRALAVHAEDPGSVP